MTFVLISFKRKTTRPILASALRTHTILFGITSIVVLVFIISSYKAAFNSGLNIEQTESFAHAIEHPKPKLQPKLEPVLPLVEQIQFRNSVRLNAPVIGQHPELPRGCEVTSLAMLLQYFNVDVTKMELADKVTKDKTPFKKTEEGIYFGNPAKGFVGDMYSFSTPGLGVYHEPIAKLAREYLGDDIKDFSGGSFYEILQHLNQNRPVWIITNSTYKQLSNDQFETWQTEDGPIRITRKEHSVLVTGYDEEYIYFNDPIRADIRKAPIKGFKEAWVQMGKQAITVVTP